MGERRDNCVEWVNLLISACYGYLGVEQLQGSKTQEVKRRVKREYFRRVTSSWKSTVNCGLNVKTHNTWARGLFRYYAQVLHWTTRKLIAMDRITRTLRAAFAHHRNASVARLYLLRKEEGRGMGGVMLNWERAVVTAGYKLKSGDPQVQAAAAFEDT